MELSEKARFFSPSVISCPLPEGRVQPYFVSVSNNGQDQSVDSALFIPYNPLCQRCVLMETDNGACDAMVGTDISTLWGNIFTGKNYAKSVLSAQTSFPMKRKIHSSTSCTLFVTP